MAPSLIVDGMSRLEVPVPRPVPALERLIALLEGISAAEPLPVVSWPTVGDGVLAVPAALVIAVRGADGDPEMEWDDLAAQWVRSAEVGGAITADDAERWFDDLRAFCGDLDGTARTELRTA
jgi:hypothetical protein